MKICSNDEYAFLSVQTVPEKKGILNYLCNSLNT